VRVIAMTNAEKVALFLNGQPLGEKPRPAYDYVEWSVPYAPGKLEAVAYKGGKEVARTTVETTGEVAALTLTPDRAWLAGDGHDAQPITISAVDALGRVVPRSDNLVTFTVTGPGRNIGHGNGDHNCHDPEQGPTRRVFHGLAQLIVQADLGAGPLRVLAESPGLKPAEVTIEVRAAPVPPALAASEPSYEVTGWRVAPAQPAKPDALVKMSTADMNTWAAVKPGNLQRTPKGQWALYRANFTPWAGIIARGGMIKIQALHGTAEVWLDGVKVAEKSDASPAELTVVLPAKAGDRELTLLVQSASGTTGLGGSVRVEVAR